jgi:glycosyltransferase involved in cell wall biosynthesis
MRVTAIVPTYRRPKDLARCLEALQKQTRLADEVVVVIRDIDAETWAFIEALSPKLSPLRTVKVTVTGVVAAMNAGLNAAAGEIICFTDDDAAPHPDWLERIEAHFLLDNQIVGVGGRDWVYFGTKLYDGAPPNELVGRVQWFGRIIGNHHLGIGQPREVDILKGTNMAFRRTAIVGLRFDERMHGTGAQVHFEMSFCLALKRAGGKLIYDPKVAVDHFRGQRFDEDLRDQFSSLALVNAIHNETLALLEYLSPVQRLFFLMWAIFLGTRSARGVLQGLRFLPIEGKLATQKLFASWQGRWEGWQTWQQSISVKNNHLLETNK